MGTQETYLAATIWVFCSVGMMVFNKIAITAFPLPLTLVFLQMIFTVLVVIVVGWKSLHIGSCKDMLLWLRVAPFFTGVLLTGILALKGAPMSLVIVFRGLAPFFGLAVERFFPNPLQETWPMVFSLFGMLAGVLLYTQDLPHGALTSVGWVILNNMFVIGDRLLQRLMLDRNQSPVDVSKPSCTIINNLAGAIIMVVVAFCNQEVVQVPVVLQGLNSYEKSMIFLTCIVGAGIAYAGVWLQSLITATSFLVLATASKFFILILEVIFMNSAMTGSQAAGASMVILFGVSYGQAKEKAIETRSSVPKESDPLIKSSESASEKKV